MPLKMDTVFTAMATHPCYFPSVRVDWMQKGQRDFLRPRRSNMHNAEAELSGANYKTTV